MEIPALPRLDMAWRRAREAARAGDVPAPAVEAEADTEAVACSTAPVLGLLAEALVAAPRPALPLVDMARRRARDASRALELGMFAVCAIVYPVASMFAFRYRIQPRPSNTTNAAPWLWV